MWHIRFWLIAGSVFASWLVGANWAMPFAIRSAHAGGGPALLRRAMANASARPLEGYLDSWHRLATSWTFLLATAILVLYVVLRIVRAVRVGVPDAAKGSDPAATTPSLRSSWLATIGVAVWFGLLGGLGEGYYMSAKVHLLAEVIPRFAPTSLELVVWMPFVNAFILGILALPVLFLRHDRALFVVFTAACLLTLLGWIRLPERVTLLPAWILALGMTVQAWRLVRTRLPEFTSHTVRSMRLGVPVLLAFAAAVYGWRLVPDWQSDVVPVASSPNVLWIVLDTERAQSMGLYGYSGSTTPRIDALARRGIVFDQAYAPASWTLPSHASMFTGRLPVDIPAMSQEPLREGATTIAQAFDAAGYATGGFIGNLFMLSEVFRMHRGFRAWRGTPVNLESLAASMWSWRTLRKTVRRRTGKHRYIVLKDGAIVNREALSWIRHLPEGRPFFAFVNYFDAHEPYTAGNLQEGAGRNRQRSAYLKRGDKAKDYDANEINDLRQSYDTSLRYLDSRVGDLLDGLDQLGEMDNTIVVITADHGEQFGEHGLLDHGNSLYRTLLQVPLIMILPEGTHAGTHVPQPVGIRRVAATVALLADVHSSIPGASLVPPMGGPDVELPVFSFLHPKGVSVVDDHYHLIANDDGTIELYDTARDPMELSDLSADSAFAGVRERLHRLIEKRQPDGG
jgi:arylsulfatase A-like enzyme